MAVKPKVKAVSNNVPYTNLETITPERAQQLLKGNTNNRTFNFRHAYRIATDISSGRWDLNGDTIKIASDGLILDGQNRLGGIILSGVAVQTMVTYNLHPSVFRSIDVNARSRGARDVLDLAGHHNSSRMAAGASLFWRLITNAEWTATPPAGFALDVIDRYPSMGVWVDRFTSSKQIRMLITPSVFIAAMTYLSDVALRPDLAERLCDGLDTGAGLVDGDPVLALRNRLINERSRPHHGGAPTRTLWPVFVRVIDALEKGDTLNRFQTERQVSSPQRPKKFAAHYAKLTLEQKMADLIATGRAVGITQDFIDKLGPTRIGKA